MKGELVLARKESIALISEGLLNDEAEGGMEVWRMPRVKGDEMLIKELKLSVIRA